MVYYALWVGAELESLTNLQPRSGCDDLNFPYYLKVSDPLRFLRLGRSAHPPLRRDRERL